MRTTAGWVRVTVMFLNKPPSPVGIVLYHTGGGLFRNITVRECRREEVMLRRPLRRCAARRD
eukprot:42088-Rhodomonas_salina.2